VFRDETDLSANPDLWPTIERALERSDYLLLLASPALARSGWVAKEVEWWLANRSVETLLIVLTAGELEAGTDGVNWEKTNALPLTLQGKVHIPLWVDFRWVAEREKWTLNDSRLEDAVATLAATLRGVEKRTLVDAHRRERRRLLLWFQGGAVALAILAVLAVYQWRQAVQQRTIAVARQLAAQAELLATTTPSRTELSALLATESLRRSSLSDADRVLRTTAPLVRSPTWTVKFDHSVEAADFDSDGRSVVAVSRDKTLRVIEGNTGKELRRYSIAEALGITQRTPAGRFVITGQKGERYAFDLRSDTPPRSLPGETIAAVSLDGKYLLIAGGDANLRTVDWDTLQEITWVPAHSSKVTAAVFSPDGRYLATGAKDKFVRGFDVGGGERWRVAAPEDTKHLRFTADNAYLMVADHADRVRLIHSLSGAIALEYVHQGWVGGIAASPTGGFVASAGADGTAIIVKPAEGREQCRLRQTHAVTAVSFSYDGRWLATAGQDRTARIYDVLTCVELFRLRHEEPVWDVAFHPSERRLLTAAYDGFLRHYDWNGTDDGIKREGEWTGLVFPARSVGVRTGPSFWRNPQSLVDLGERLSPDITTLVALSADAEAIVLVSLFGTLYQLDIEDFSAKQRIMMTRDGPRLTAAAALGKHLATGSENGRLFAFEFGSKKPGREFPLGERALAVGLGKGGSLLAAGGNGKRVHVFDVENGTPLLTWDVPAAVTAVAIDAAGERMVVGAANEVVVIDLGARREVYRYEHQNWVNGVAISTDGGVVASGSADRTARLVDWKARREVARISYDAMVRAVGFTRDGKWLVTATARNNLMIRWHRVHRDDLLRDACLSLGRSMSREEWREYLGTETYRKTCEDLR
jgi:WD40 repeat protein